MAKIYETHKDLERDVLKEQVHNLQYKGERQSNLSGAWIIGGILVETWNRARQVPSRILSTLSTAAFVVGIVEIVRSFMTYNKAHNAHLQRERLGPERVILPPDESNAQISDILAKGARSPLEHANRDSAEKSCCER